MLFRSDAVAQRLIDVGADISAARKDGQTPLHAAVESGHEVVARLLIDGSADVSAADKDGSTPLHVAERNGHEAVARLLRGRGAIGAQLVAARARPPPSSPALIVYNVRGVAR